MVCHFDIGDTIFLCIAFTFNHNLVKVDVIYDFCMISTRKHFHMYSMDFAVGVYCMIVISTVLECIMDMNHAATMKPHWYDAKLQ